ncbi:hypothetical protein [Kribbella sp. NPDC006257]|uniref:hypothetical protein n=1 Tax=Kribbella sp. NPDC006257 TaxID=3156738 RepID=UPI0033BA7C13
MKRIVLTLATAAVLTTAGVATAYAVHADDHPSGVTAESPVPTGSLTAAKAAEQAVKDVPGGVVTDVDWDDNTWELDVRAGSTWRELTYDPNGKLLSNHPDNTRSDDTRDDHDDD